MKFEESELKLTQEPCDKFYDYLENMDLNEAPGLVMKMAISSQLKTGMKLKDMTYLQQNSFVNIGNVR